MKKMSLEEGFTRLDEITSKMEKGELTLDEMYSLYKEGIDIVKLCTDQIDIVEKNILLVDPKGGMTEFE